MKWTFVLAFLTLLTISSACDDDHEEEVSDCIAATLKRENLDRYHGQELGCKSFLTLYTLYDEKFFMYGNACAYRIFYAFDCTGEEFCEPATSECANYFLNNATSEGIVGISKE